MSDKHQVKTSDISNMAEASGSKKKKTVPITGPGSKIWDDKIKAAIKKKIEVDKAKELQDHIEINIDKMWGKKPTVCANTGGADNCHELPPFGVKQCPVCLRGNVKL